MATDRTLYLYHVTHKNNWYSIGVQGLLAYMSGGAYQAVFLCTESKIPYLITHVARIHGLIESELIVVKVRVRRSNCTRVAWRNHPKGLYRHNGNIDPCRIEWIETWPELTPPANSPVNPFRESSEQWTR